MRDILICKNGETIYSSNKDPDFNKLIGNIVKGIQNIVESFFSDNFIKFTINGYQTALYVTDTNLEIYIISNVDMGTDSIYKKIYEIYSKCTILNDFDLLGPLLNELC
ncbi:hypothetical protein EDEG_03093 [Edhazardia aedis USNM 41457]|uniref:Trafficking protein particle complex subunit n=1 Tax=Edhazardia aedis (strain USNM 41457) TaxID=1003232 RepID=J9DMA7_EDHAE|nr:hypothetical protein EDEG_03093 [Edhazardia aedis USNM 41457]|eukprot:EJW02507.1 hypothetical protein EDEG_03093 [Edhazardia aedis USNM 41457]